MTINFNITIRCGCLPSQLHLNRMHVTKYSLWYIQNQNNSGEVQLCILKEKGKSVEVGLAKVDGCIKRFE